MSDRHEYGFFIELRHQLRQSVELRVSKETDEVLAIAWDNMITLQMERDIPESDRISVNIEGPNGNG